MSPECCVTIVGGGVGGLALAAGLLRRGVRVQIYEAAAAFEEIGLGLSLGPAAHRAMPLIDPRIRASYDQLVTTHADSPGFEHLRETWFEIVWATSQHAPGTVLMDLKAPPSGQTTAKRSEFLDALLQLVPSEVCHFGKRLEHLKEGPTGVSLSFKDGTTVQADVVVGCDGIKSKVKETVVPEAEERGPQYSGMYCYRGVVDMDKMIAAVGERRARVSSMYLAHGAYAITYPIMRAESVNVGLYKMSDGWKHEKWIQPVERDTMMADFAHMGDGIQAILKNVEDCSQWAVFEHPPIASYVQSRVAIMGDAAHASTPHQGAGAGQAIEDAHVLAELLADDRVHTSQDCVAAFQAYDEVRRPRSQQVVSSSKENSFLLCLCKEGIMDDGPTLVRSFETRFKWLWNIDVEKQAQNAIASMHSIMDAQTVGH